MATPPRSTGTCRTGPLAAASCAAVIGISVWPKLAVFCWIAVTPGPLPEPVIVDVTPGLSLLYWYSTRP